MGPYPCYTEGPTIRTIGREGIPSLNVPNEQEKHELYEIAVDYREELRIICEVWEKGVTKDFMRDFQKVWILLYISISNIFNSIKYVLIV
jgi:hypothetical protein